MKVALLHDVPGIGKKREIKNVNSGYALNYLFPKKMAETATGAVMARIELENKRDVGMKKVKEDLLAKNLNSIHGVRVEVELPANEKGHLFAGLHASEIVEFAKNQSKVELMPEFIVLPKPIKEIGDHEIVIKVQGKQAVFTLSIKAK